MLKSKNLEIKAVCIKASLSMSVPLVQFNVVSLKETFPDKGRLKTEAFGGVLATAIINSLWFLLLKVSFAITVKLIILPLNNEIVKFCEHLSLLPEIDILKNLF